MSGSLEEEAKTTLVRMRLADIYIQPFMLEQDWSEGSNKCCCRTDMCRFTAKDLLKYMKDELHRATEEENT